MNLVLQPWQLLFFILAGWINRQQQNIIEYLLIENQALKHKLARNGFCLTMTSGVAWPPKEKY